MIRLAYNLFGCKNLRCSLVPRKLSGFHRTKFSTELNNEDMKGSKELRRRVMKDIVLRHLDLEPRATTSLSQGGSREGDNSFGLVVKRSNAEGHAIVAPDVIDTTKTIFPEPKSFLYQMYQDKKFAETLSYNDGLWTCSYDVRWPYRMTVSASGHKKKEATERAALSLLHYLTKADNIKTKEEATCLSKRLSLLHRRESINRIQARNISTSSQRRNRSSNSSKEKLMEDELAPPLEPESINVIAGSKEIDEIHNLFPHPKNVLHNCFDLLAQELKKNDLKLTPHYKYNSLTKTWACTYHLKWPEEVKFTKSAVRKLEASHKCAIACLHWLKMQKKINTSGQPLLFQKEAIRDLKQRSSVLSLSRDVEDNLNLISELYTNKLLKHLTADFDEAAEEKSDGAGEEELESLWPKEAKQKRRQRYLGLDVYLAKEKKELPISRYKQEIIDTIDNNRILLIKGEPGCGKSTRVPQYVLEGWAKNNEEEPCRIVVTQPRRIAAISLAERVAYEREEDVGDIVGYQVRLKSNFNNQTGRILYCTTGILLRHIQSDPSLSDCTHVLLDEAHERDVNTDLLMNLLKHAMKLNPNLKLVIMSATIDTSLFQQYFKDVPVKYITGFSHPVSAHFIDNTKTLDFSKTLKMCEGDTPEVVHEDVVNLIRFIHAKKPEGAILCFLPGWEDIIKLKKKLPQSSSDMMVLCLHSMLQDSDQRLVFSRPPPGVRKIVLATNIAETSITIDDVVYVIDTGIHKENRFDIEKGITCIDNHWISQSSMTQRKGRAGRVQPGESFHLYPRGKAEAFEAFSIPEILRTSLTKIVLDSKVYSNNMDAVEFLSQLPSPPEEDAVKQAVEELKELELLDESENLTPLGRVLSNFQLEPKLSKAMVNAIVFKCVTPIVDVVTLFSSEQEIFATALTHKDEIKATKTEFSKHSDHLSLMRIFEKWLEYTEDRDVNSAREFTRANNLVDYKLGTLRKLREIHFEYLSKGLQSVLPISDDFSDNDEVVKAVLLSGVSTVLQRRNWDVVKGRLRKANVLLTRHNHKATIASASVNYKRSEFPTDFLLYINETRSNVRRTTTIRETSLISPLAVLLFKTGKLDITDVRDVHEQLASQDQVRLALAGTKIEFICDRKQAEAVVKCKDALQAGLQYYTFQLTKGAEYNNKINKYWREILSALNRMFTIKTSE